MGACCSKAHTKSTKPEVISEKTNPISPVVRFNWKRGRIISEGSYAKVFEAFNLDTGQTMAAKHVSLPSDRSLIDREVLNLQRELALLQSLSHPNIVKYLHVEVSPDMSGLDILLEYVPGGSVRTLLNKFGKLDEKVVRRYTQHLLTGLTYLHCQGIIHRDIKCANLLVDRDGTVKLSDFGACKHLGALTIDSTLCRTTSLRGSPYWMSPEVVSRTGHSFSADIWSVGCTVIEMLTGTPPWSGLSKNSREVLKLISQGPPEIPSFVSPSCNRFLQLCLTVDSTLRPTAAELLSHPFITEVSELEAVHTRSSTTTACKATNLAVIGSNIGAEMSRKKFKASMSFLNPKLRLLFSSKRLDSSKNDVREEPKHQREISLPVLKPIFEVIEKQQLKMKEPSLGLVRFLKPSKVKSRTKLRSVEKGCQMTPVRSLHSSIRTPFVEDISYQRKLTKYAAMQRHQDVPDGSPTISPEPGEPKHLPKLNRAVKTIEFKLDSSAPSEHNSLTVERLQQYIHYNSRIAFK